VIPFLDNFPGRFQSTVDGIALLMRAALVGWQWHYLGGYQLSSDGNAVTDDPGRASDVVAGSARAAE
jgi:hypothetical protein